MRKDILRLSCLLLVVLVFSPSVFSQDSLQTEPIKPVDKARLIHMFTANNINGKYLKGFGVNYSNFQYSPYDRLGLGIYLGYENSELKESDLNIKMNSAQLGLRIMGRVVPRLYISGIIGVQLGQEQIQQTVSIPNFNTGTSTQVTNTSKELFIGLASSEGIFFVPKKNEVITFGLSCYQRRFNSDRFNFEVGWMLSLGFSV
jgi:hypothetical protein